MKLAPKVFSIGGRLGYVDDGETANTQMAVFDYGDAARGGKGFQVTYSSRQTNSAGGTKEIYYSNGGSLNLDTNKIGPEGGPRPPVSPYPRHANALDRQDGTVRRARGRARGTTPSAPTWTRS